MIATKPKLVTLTGSGGDAPAAEGSTRGIIFGGIAALLAFVSSEYSLISDDGVAKLGPFVVALSFAAAGLWDKFVRPRLSS
jgi:hypothetical protein